MKNKKQTSMRDISKITGVSISTISRYINSSGYVKSSTGEKIEAAINKTNYVPNRNVKSVFGYKSHNIGLIVPAFTNPFFSEFSTYIGNYIQEAGYGCILCFTSDDINAEVRNLDLLKGYRVDGVISARSLYPEVWSNLEIPTVSFESNHDEQEVNVCVDNYNGGEIAFNYLNKIGTKRFVHVRGPENFKATNERFNGFYDSAKAINKNIKIIKSEKDYSLEADFRDNLKGFKFNKGDGIFVFNDINAINIISYLIDLGFKVPEDISVIGFDNSYISDMLIPRLTTIEQPVKEIAAKCFSSLLELIENKNVVKSELVLPVRLVIRDSTR